GASWPANGQARTDPMSTREAPSRFREGPTTPRAREAYIGWALCRAKSALPGPETGSLFETSTNGSQGSPGRPSEDTLLQDHRDRRAPRHRRLVPRAPPNELDRADRVHRDRVPWRQRDLRAPLPANRGRDPREAGLVRGCVLLQR